MNPIELTILMPALNEAETLAACINKAQQFLARENILGEILIADNGSRDGSQAIAKSHGARVIAVPMRGYGAALMAGIQASLGQFVIMGDADDSYDFDNLSLFMKKLRDGYDLVIGNRFQGGIKQGAMPWLNKYVGNPILSFLGKMFFKSPIGDFHCGLRGFKREAMQKLNLQAKGMEFASEMIIKATLQQLKITEVPTVLSPDGRSRRPHLRPWRDGWRHLRLLLLLSPKWLFLYPGIALIFSGMILILLLLQGPLKLGKCYFDIHTMLFAGMFIIAGLQAVYFSVFSKVIGIFQMKLPEKKSMMHFLKHFTLEKGLLVGLALIFLGGYGSVYTFLFWKSHEFGRLIPSEVMRILIPSVTCLIAGMQVTFASFFMNILTLHYAIHVDQHEN